MHGQTHIKFLCHILAVNSAGDSIQYVYYHFFVLMSCAVIQEGQLPLQTPFKNCRWKKKRVLATQTHRSATKTVTLLAVRIRCATFYRATHKSSWKEVWRRWHWPSNTLS